MCVKHVLRFAFYFRKVQHWATHFTALHPASYTRILSSFKKYFFKMSADLDKQST